MEDAMAKFLAVFGLAAALFGMPANVFAAEDYNPAALPHDKASVDKLNELQLGILRAAVRSCSAFGRSQHSSNFCVTTNTDQDVRASNNEALKAFHFGLPPMDRYDEYRSQVDLQRIYGRR
jgi:hypothetical protein